MMRQVCLALGALLILTGSADAQITISPTSAFAFTPSADHNTLSGGQPILTSYEIGAFTRTVAQSTTPCPAMVPTGIPIVVNLGKPAPVGGTITSMPIQPMTQFVAGQFYCAYIKSVGPGGSSALVNPAGPFARPGPTPVPAAPSTLSITP